MNLQHKMEKANKIPCINDKILYWHVFSGSCKTPFAFYQIIIAIKKPSKYIQDRILSDNEKMIYSARAIPIPMQGMHLQRVSFPLLL